MNATTPSTDLTKKPYFSRKRIALLLIGTLIGIQVIRQEEPVFNDVNYANLRDDLERTASLPEGSPEQAVVYMTLGKHLNKPVYGTWNGLDVVRWIRDPRNPLRPLFRLHPDLKNDWEVKGGDGLSNRDHYGGFAVGPIVAARTLFQESAPQHLDRLNALFVKHAGTDPESLDRDAQEKLLHKALVEDSEGRGMVEDLTSTRLLGAQARGYGTLATVTGIPGLGLRWMQRNCLWLFAVLIVLRRCLRTLRRWVRDLRVKGKSALADKACDRSVPSRSPLPSAERAGDSQMTRLPDPKGHRRTTSWRKAPRTMLIRASGTRSNVEVPPNGTL